VEVLGGTCGWNERRRMRAADQAASKTPASGREARRARQRGTSRRQSSHSERSCSAPAAPSSHSAPRRSSTGACIYPRGRTTRAAVASERWACAGSATLDEWSIRARGCSTCSVFGGLEANPGRVRALLTARVPERVRPRPPASARVRPRPPASARVRPLPFERPAFQAECRGFEPLRPLHISSREAFVATVAEYATRNATFRLRLRRSHHLATWFASPGKRPRLRGVPRPAERLRTGLRRDL